eukprot:Gb_28658 [translate_table: standard]
MGMEIGLAWACTRVGMILVMLMSLLLCISAPCKLMHSPLPMLDFSLFQKLDIDARLSFDTASGALDFGRIYHNNPAAILRPRSAEEIAVFLRAIYASSPYDLTVAAKGAGHSIHGQAQAPNGVVIEMCSLKGIAVHNRNGNSYADVSAGELWVDLLKETLKVGLAPRSWTDYLYLSIGGTLSNAGISGQTFRHGPQISNVLELDLITGTGEAVTCSPTQNAELFYASMGGLGQFGIITRARIILEPAPRKVRWVRAFYDDFHEFTRDQELLISVHQSADSVDYVEGFMVLNNDAMRTWSVAFPSTTQLNSSFLHDIGNDIYYCIEIAKYYTDEHGTDSAMGHLLSRMWFKPSLIDSVEVSYFDFLNRVRAEELDLRSRGLWDIPHPWLNMFVPRNEIQRFTDTLLRIMSPDGVRGPILIYPVNRSKWNPNMSVVLPENEDDIFYVVGVLRSAEADNCFSGSSCLENLLAENQEIIELSTTCNAVDMALEGLGLHDHMMSRNTAPAAFGMGAKQYLSYYSHEWQWKIHFGSKWRRFVDRKAKFDPLNILAPGQRILRRKNVSKAAFHYLQQG